MRLSTGSVPHFTSPSELFKTHTLFFFQQMKPMPTIKETVSHERTHDSVTFFPGISIPQIPRIICAALPYSGSCWFYYLENESFPSLLCPATWPNSIPQHSLSFPLYCALPPASPLTAGYLTVSLSPAGNPLKLGTI